MAFVMTIILLVASIVYFCMDIIKKKDRNGIGRALFYIAMPVLAALAVCINAMSTGVGISDVDIIENSVSRFESIEKSGIDFSYALGIVIQLLLSLPIVIISAAGCVSVIHYETDKNTNIPSFGTNSAYRAGKLLKISSVSALASIVSGLAAIIFCTIALVYSVSIMTVGILELIIGGMLLSMLTFGIGLIIAVFAIPIYTVFIGAGVLINCIPYAVSAFAFGSAFCILHILTILFAAFSLKQLYKDEIISKKSALVSGILSAIPIVNIVALIYSFNKIKSLSSQ